MAKSASARRGGSTLKAAFTFNEEAPEAVAWAKEHTAELIKDLSDTTERAIKDAVAKAFEDGLRGSDLVSLIDDAIGDEPRAEMIAQSEVMLAVNNGQREAWSQAVDEGYLSAKSEREWIANPDACDECGDLDGQTAPLDGEYPDDGGDGPPLHPRCECTEGISGQ